MSHILEVQKLDDSTQTATPRHGFRGENQASRPLKGLPQNLTLAVSRETGSRGIVIAKQAAKRLGWPFYNQESLEYMAQEEHLARQLFAELTPDQEEWVEQQLHQLLHSESVSRNPSILELARIVLALGSKGSCVLLGRGAGCILPPRSTLYVRVVAPIQDRIAFLAQLERLTPEQAAQQVVLRDEQRAEFVRNHFFRSPADLYQFDLLLNSSKLGEELATQIVVSAAKKKAASWLEQTGVAT